MRNLFVTLIVAGLLTGCGIIYKQPIYQGSLVQPTAVEQLREGMSRQQVSALLGTPSIADPFHHDRWDYTASQRNNRLGRTEIKNLTVWFENNQVARWEGEYFPKQDEELAAEMRKFGNLPRERRR
ncbi:outer membrane protein assembly factor BamE [Luteimonas abyssi]|uniref:outer membrane protein assembly factor BamE n=1 Tax=Luteimonas abyssi TaxID=1247514 RepID=UPI000737C9D1|nr:outer membrane protein assembly factor BamE [Luteimonas abyssi]